MASYYGLGQMNGQNLELSDIADVIIDSTVKRNSNNNKTFELQYKHQTQNFTLVKSDNVPHEHDAISLANLDDLDESVTEIKATNSRITFGFVLNPITNLMETVIL